MWEMHKIVEKIFGWSYPLFKKWDFGETLSSYLSLAINIIVLMIIAYVIYRVFRFILVRSMIIIARRTKTRFDDLLVSNQTAKYIAHLIPFLFIYKSVPVILESYVYWESVFGKMVVSLGFLLGYKQIAHPTNQSFVIIFLLCYVVYTGFEVRFMTQLAKG